MSKPSRLTIFVVFTTMILATPLFALLSAMIYAKIWDLLLAKQYGDGPSYQSWYGIAVLITLVTMHLNPQKEADKDARKNLVAIVIGKIVGAYVGMGAVLLLVMFVCFALGWSR